MIGKHRCARILKYSRPTWNLKLNSSSCGDLRTVHDRRAMCYVPAHRGDVDRRVRSTVDLFPVANCWQIVGKRPQRSPSLAIDPRKTSSQDRRAMQGPVSLKCTLSARPGPTRRSSHRPTHKAAARCKGLRDTPCSRSRRTHVSNLKPHARATQFHLVGTCVTQGVDVCQRAAACGATLRSNHQGSLPCSPVGTKCLGCVSTGSRPCTGPAKADSHQRLDIRRSGARRKNQHASMAFKELVRPHGIELATRQN